MDTSGITRKNLTSQYGISECDPVLILKRGNILMKSSLSLIAGIIGVLAALLLIGHNPSLYFVIFLIIALAGAIIAIAIGNRAWNKNKDRIGLVGAILGLITWVVVLFIVFNIFIF